MNLAEYKNIVIVGLGKTGTSCCKFLHGLNINFIVNDSRTNPPGLAEVQTFLPQDRIILGQFEKTLLLKADLVILSQGIPLQDPVIASVQQAGINIISDVDIFAAYAKAPIIAITGSNAKSTVTSLVGHVLKQSGVDVVVGGNIGIPLLDILSQVIPAYYVVELSNFQLELTHELNAFVACILNLSPDHMDRYASYQDYVATKQRIYQNCDKAIYFLEDELTYPPKDISKVYFSGNKPNANNFGLQIKNNEIFLSYGDHAFVNVNELPLPGRHGWMNALAAAAICFQTGITLTQIASALKTFIGLEHRCQLVARHNQIDWINDSKGTNIGATLAALRGLGPTCQGKIILILGGRGKGADFTELAEPIKQYCKSLLVYGEDANKIKQALQDSSELAVVKGVTDAVIAANAKTCPGDIVLFSPACASFDMFENFEQRGYAFMADVKEIVINAK